MSTTRFSKISAFVLFSLTILRSAAQNSTNATSAPTADQLQEYNRICASQAKANGEDAPTNWVWSVTDEGCVNNGASGNSTTAVSTKLTGRGDDGVDTIVGDALLPRDRCQEGSLEQCFQGCNDQFKVTRYKSGESGAWVGCRASCNFRCSVNEGGCYNGWCWATCATGVPIVEGHEWCYTTRGYSQDYRYIECRVNEDCDANWKCAGPCAAF